jgi:hypothetical protein
METTMTITVDSQTQPATNLISRSRAVLGDSGLVALFFTLSLLATVYFAIHSPAAASLFVNFPD